MEEEEEEDDDDHDILRMSGVIRSPFAFMDSTTPLPTPLFVCW
jgi:hypothetical protein